jgi:phosphoribosylformimino-5-aminoimidazole carboxamide ribotide isomerase
MQIYPSIDLRGGKVVRLKEGDPNRQTVFSEDPLAVARQWIRGGADWIHIVNLDGTFDTANDNGLILENIAHLNVKVQFGGGLRSLYAISRAFEQGASRVVLGTIAIEQPGIVVDAINRWGADHVCVALDARDGKIATHGWQQKTDVTPIEFGKKMAADGVIHALYTDVNRDGLLGGVNVETTAALGRETGLQVIASGGVSSLDDVRNLKATGSVAGVVIGIALYEGKFTLEQAIQTAE